MHAVGSRLQKRGVKILYLVVRLYLQIFYAFNVLFTCRLAVIGKISCATSHRINRQNDIVFNERECECKNKNQHAAKERDNFRDENLAVI